MLYSGLLQFLGIACSQCSMFNYLAFRMVVAKESSQKSMLVQSLGQPE